MKNKLVAAAAVLALGYAASAYATANVSVGYGSIPSGLTDEGQLSIEEPQCAASEAFYYIYNIGPNFYGTATGPDFTYDFSFTAPTDGKVDATLSLRGVGSSYTLGLYNGASLVTAGAAGTDSYNGPGTPDIAFGLTTIAAGTYDIIVTGTVDGNGDALANFQVNETPAATGGVPEPATWAMLLLGFAGIGVALRRRPLESSSAA